MATTTNYGWTTPNDTDLVKDGAAAIRTLGSSVDTTTKALNPSTTLGDIEYRSSTANTNTRLGIGSTGQVLTVAGGVPTWATSDDANAIQNALLTTTGDTIYASGASTPARLGIGTTGQVLTVASGVPSWATPASGGGTTFNLINSGGTTLSGTSTTVSSIPTDGTYNHLMIRVIGAYANANDGMGFRINSDSGANYAYGYNQASNNTFDGYSDHAGTDGRFGGLLPGSSTTVKSFNSTLWIYNYLDTSIRFCPAQSMGGFSGSNSYISGMVNNFYVGGSALSSIEFRCVQTFAGGKVYVYGVK
jgi:hypothetical protein